MQWTSKTCPRVLSSVRQAAVTCSVSNTLVLEPPVSAVQTDFANLSLVTLCLVVATLVTLFPVHWGFAHVAEFDLLWSCLNHVRVPSHNLREKHFVHVTFNDTVIVIALSNYVTFSEIPKNSNTDIHIIKPIHLIISSKIHRISCNTKIPL